MDRTGTHFGYRCVVLFLFVHCFILFCIYHDKQQKGTEMALDIKTPKEGRVTCYFLFVYSPLNH